MNNHDAGNAQANPYQSPVVIEDARGQADPWAASHRWVYFAWPVVYVLNLIVPMLIAEGTLVTYAYVGCGCGIAVWFLMGLAVCYFLPKLGTQLIVGSVLVALSQLLPILHIIAGIVGLGTTAALGLGGLNETGRVTTATEGFVATLITGGILLAASIVAGALAIAVYEHFRARRSKSI